MSLAELKVPGGKLARLRRETSGGKTVVQLSGDFFVHPEEGLACLEERLAGIPETAPEEAVRKALEEAIREGGLELIGLDPGAIARLFRECCQCGG